MRTGTTRRTVLLKGMLLAVLLPLVGCGGGAPTPADPQARKLLIIGWDSADWRLLEPMLEDGRLPVLDAFMDQAAYGKLKTFYPLEKSPLLWASITTGVLPAVHGVDNFVKGGEQKPVTGSAWFAPALWDIVGAAGLSSSVVGMWTTYPARAINGVMVSDYLPYGVGRENPLAGLVAPDSLAERILALRVAPEDVTDADLARFIDADRLAEAWQKYPTEMNKLRAVFAADLSYLNVNRMLAAGDPYDLFLFYLRGPDMVSHYFYHYMVPERSRIRIEPAEGEIFAEVVRRYYDWVDEVTGEVLGWFPPDRQAVILSDHGFYGPRDDGGKGSHEHSEWGIFLARGPLFAPDTRFDHVALLDACPTFLAMMGLPPAADMPGRILAESLTPAGRKLVERMEKHRVPSYLGLRPAEGPAGEVDAGVDEEIRKQLRSLGYIQ